MLQVVTTKDEVIKHHLQRVRLVGRYQEKDVRMVQKPPPRFAGHVVIVLDDGSSVLLYPVWNAQAKRSPEEIAEFAGKRVVVEGVISRVAPDSPQKSANLRMPAMISVDSITLAPG